MVELGRLYDTQYNDREGEELRLGRRGGYSEAVREGAEGVVL